MLTRVTLDVGPGLRVLGFTLSVSVLATLLFGLAPALRASRTDLISSLKEQVPVITVSGHKRLGARDLIVITQVALSLVLLIGAGLAIRSLRRAQTADLGFDKRNVLVFSYDLRLQGYGSSILRRPTFGIRPAWSSPDGANGSRRRPALRNWRNSHAPLVAAARKTTPKCAKVGHVSPWRSKALAPVR